MKNETKEKASCIRLLIFWSSTHTLYTAWGDDFVQTFWPDHFKNQLRSLLVNFMNNFILEHLARCADVFVVLIIKMETGGRRTLCTDKERNSLYLILATCNTGCERSFRRSEPLWPEVSIFCFAFSSPVTADNALNSGLIPRWDSYAKVERKFFLALSP